MVDKNGVRMLVYHINCDSMDKRRRNLIILPKVKVDYPSKFRSEQRTPKIYIWWVDTSTEAIETTIPTNTATIVTRWKRWTQC